MTTPPFMIDHLDYDGVMATLRVIMPFAAGKPATVETMWEIIATNPEGLPPETSPETALKCVQWAIDLSGHRKREIGKHRADAVKLAITQAEVKARFKIAGKNLFARRSMWRPSRKKHDQRKETND